MTHKVIDTLKRVIDSQYHLPRQQRDWCLANNVRIRAPNRNAIGFSLDNESSRPFGFLGNSPPEHIAKMCDAIIAVIHKKQAYLFVIEQKTSNKGDYKRQIANGKLFCDWLISLCRYHGYIPNESVKYIALLVWQPRTTPPKGMTTHRQPKQAPSHPLFERVVDERNNPLVQLQRLT